MSLEFVLQFWIHVLFYCLYLGYHMVSVKPGATSYIDSVFLNVIILKKGKK